MNRIAVLIHIIILLISCDNSKKGDGKKVFRYNAANGITSLDPAFARNQDNIWACNQLFNGLVQTNENLDVVPAIAKRWFIGDSGKTYTFILNNSVYFHPSKVFKNGQGRKVIAQDFVYSFQRIINPQTASPGAWIFNDKLQAEDIVAMNDTTLVIRLQKPFPPFLGMLTMPYCFVVPHEAVDFYGKDFGFNPVGTGPFLFKDWHDDIKLNLLKNTHYFESSKGQMVPKIDAISISFIQSRQTEFLEFIQNKLDMFNGLESSFKDELLTKNGHLQPKYAKDFKLIKAPFLNTEYLAFNVDGAKPGSIIQDIHFRRALQLAIHRPHLIKYLRNEVGNAALQGFLPLGLPGFDDSANYYPFNTTEAKSELAMSAYKPTDNLVLYTTRDYLDICLYVQKQVSEIGVKIDVEVLPSALLKTQKAEGRLDFFRASWIADYPDAENYLSCFLSENKAPAGPNYTRFSNQSFDKLYKEALAEIDVKRRIGIYQSMNRILMENAVIIPLFYDQSVRLYRKSVKGIYKDALNTLQIKYIELE